MKHCFVHVPLVRRAQRWVAKVLRPGDRAMDATLGNGYDTLFLARQVGATGRVYGLDVQPRALANTRRRLHEAGVEERVTLLCCGHELLAQHVRGPLRAAMFNLGYLPGGDRGLTTRPNTTRIALAAASARLGEGGILTVTTYRGHPGGQEETEAVWRWVENLPAKAFIARVESPLSAATRDDTPLLFIVRRRSSPHN